jgi:hypothetical protein
MVAVIPAFGRYTLLKQTISRLPIQSVVIGHESAVEQICEETGALFVYHPNTTLGEKWNAGFLIAKHLKPDSVLFIGSSDWVSSNWVDECSKYLGEYDMIGKLGCYLLDISHPQYAYRLINWHGYGKGRRENEPIGIGRVISSRVLDQMGWKPFDSTKDNSMDWQMYEKVLKYGGKIKLMGDEVHSMALSTNLWPNKHQFQDHWKNRIPHSEIIPDYKKFLNEWFPDALTLRLK